MDKKRHTISSIIKHVKSLTETNKAEEAQVSNDPPWIRYVAMLTGVLAAMAGILTVRTTNLTNEAIYESNQAILAQAEASDAWSEYQADSIKARVIETQIVPSSPLSAEDKEGLAKIDSDLRTRQPLSKKTAQDKGEERQNHLNQGFKRLAEKDLLGYASLTIQLGIALASIAALVRRRVAFNAGILAGLVGIIITVYAFWVHFLG